MHCASRLSGLCSRHQKVGAYWGELGWILEDNEGMISILEEIGCEIYKTCRVYEKAIG